MGYYLGQQEADDIFEAVLFTEVQAKTINRNSKASIGCQPWDPLASFRTRSYQNLRDAEEAVCTGDGAEAGGTDHFEGETGQEGTRDLNM